MNGVGELFVWALARENNRKTKDKNRIIALKQKDGKYIKYGALLSNSQRLAQLYPGVLDELREIHDRRNTDAESHALNEKTGRRTKTTIQSGEITTLKKKARIGLEKVCVEISRLCKNL